MDIKCEKCKKKFFTGLQSHGGTFTFKGGIDAVCSYCGHINHIDPHVMQFNTQGDIIKAYLIDSEIPENDLLKFIEVVKVYKSKNSHDEGSFKNEVASINPKFLGLFNLEKISIDTIIAFLGLLISLYTAIKNDTSTVDKSIHVTNTISNTTQEKPLSNKLLRKPKKGKSNHKKRKH